MQSPQPSAWQTERSKKSQGHYHHRGAVTAFMEAIFPAPPPIPTHALALANGTDANFMKADEAFLLFLPLLFACPPQPPSRDQVKPGRELHGGQQHHPSKTVSRHLTSQLPTDVSELSPVERNYSADFYTRGKQQNVVVSNHYVWG